MKRGYGFVTLFSLSLVFLLVACHRQPVSSIETTENLSAKNMLQGIWLDDETDLPFMRVEGDTIFYPDAENLPVAFFVRNDTFFVVGADTLPYTIDLQTSERFKFHQLDDLLISLYRSENSEDSLYFEETPVTIPVITERIEKDSVVMFEGKRYRGYVYINPSTMKVIRTSMSASGMLMDNVYYDNVIHICVYTGATLLYGKDITKQQFADYLPEDVIAGSVLVDMNFLGVDATGYRYQALLAEPESPVSYVLNLTITEDKQLLIEVAS